MSSRRSVYFAACDAAALVNIGAAEDVTSRFEELRAGSPLPLACPPPRPVVTAALRSGRCPGCAKLLGGGNRSGVCNACHKLKKSARRCSCGGCERCSSDEAREEGCGRYLDARNLRGLCKSCRGRLLMTAAYVAMQRIPDIP